MQIHDNEDKKKKLRKLSFYFGLNQDAMSRVGYYYLKLSAKANIVISVIDLIIGYLLSNTEKLRITSLINKLYPFYILSWLIKKKTKDQN